MSDLVPVQGDLFLCDIVSWPVKDDLASMELPIFSLSKNKDTSIREFKSGNRTVRVIPSSVGAATVFDKDLLIYIASQIVEAKNVGKPVSRTVQIESFDFLSGTERGHGRATYERILDMLMRLRGTTVETNVETGGIRQTEGFGLIDSYKIISEKKRTEKIIDERGKTVPHEVSRVFSFQVTISEWLMNSLNGFEVLTLNRAYFLLNKSIERRLYGLARKHCGDKAMWKIGMDLLAEKVGISKDQPRFRFRDDIRQAIKGDRIPDYRLALDPTNDQVIFYTRNTAKLSLDLMADTNKMNWWHTLERFETLPPAKAAIEEV